MTEIAWTRLTAAGLQKQAALDAIAIVPIGSTEQHGPHLPTGVDVMLVTEVARRAALRTVAPVLVLPTIWTGLAEHHMSLGGTITLDMRTFSSLIEGVCRSLLRQGFRRILLLNGHGGNIAALTTLVNDLGPRLAAPIATATYWQLADEAFRTILEDQSTVQHACEAETSMMLALAPDLVAMNEATAIVGPVNVALAGSASADAYRWRSFQARTPHGVLGDPRRATAAKGERLFEAAADAVARVIGDQTFWDEPA
jgi:creatinine amidohydrolase